MNKQVLTAINRLQAILPIKSRLDGLDTESARVYQNVVEYFYHHGAAPMLSDLNDMKSDVRTIIDSLADLDMLTLNEQGEVKGCYPFTSENRIHQILINGIEAHAMCALDALAPSAMFGCNSVVTSKCEVTGEPVFIELESQRILNPDVAGGVYFGLNWLAASSCGSCADNLCTEMLFLKDQKTAQDWSDQDNENREVFSLTDAVAFSAGFFVPLMKQG